MFKKTTAKIGLSAHIGSSKHYARIIKRLINAIKGDISTQEADSKKIDEGIKNFSIKTVDMGITDLIKSGKDEAIKLDKISESGFILEFRMEKELKKLVKNLTKLKKDKNIGQEIQQNLDKLHQLFDRIHTKIRTQRKMMRDLKYNRDKLRDKTIMTNLMLFISLKHSARMEKHNVGKVKKAMSEMEKIINDLNSGKGNAKEVQKITAAIVNLKKNIEEELSNITKIESSIVYIEERLKHLNSKNFEKVRALAQKGFPKKILQKVSISEQDFLKTLNKQQRKEYDRVDALYKTKMD